jgi:hypothetical protein
MQYRETASVGTELRCVLSLARRSSSSRSKAPSERTFSVTNELLVRAGSTTDAGYPMVSGRELLWRGTYSDGAASFTVEQLDGDGDGRAPGARVGDDRPTRARRTSSTSTTCAMPIPITARAARAGLTSSTDNDVRRANSRATRARSSRQAPWAVRVLRDRPRLVRRSRQARARAASRTPIASGIWTAPPADPGGASWRHQHRPRLPRAAAGGRRLDHVRALLRVGPHRGGGRGALRHRWRRRRGPV